MSEKIICKIIVGSQAFGTATPTSDVDTCEIYMCDTNDLLGFTYKEHDDVDKDNRRYELGKYLKLLYAGNPSSLEILYTPDDCILQSSPEWEYIRSFSTKFVTKNLYNTFCKYAETQIQKAKNLNKKANWEEQRVQRKTLLDFCYVLPFDGKHQSIQLETYLKNFEHTIDQKDCGLTKIDHMKDCYLLYISKGEYQGVVRDEFNTDVVLSSVGHWHSPSAILYCNKDGYSMHCKDYNQYQQWLKDRSELRFAVNKAHGQLFDGKNLAHTVRLLKTARDIAEKGIVVVRRNPEEVKYLLSIKHGEVDLKEMVELAESESKALKAVFENSSLPDGVDFELVNQLVINIRKGNFPIYSDTPCPKCGKKKIIEKWSGIKCSSCDYQYCS